MTIDLPPVPAEPTRRRRTRHSRRRRRARRQLGALLIGTLLLVLAVVVWTVPFGSSTPGDRQPHVAVGLESPAHVGEIRDIQLGSPTAEPAVRRPRYRYSVVSGGVLDAAEVQQVRALDPVVAAHYRGIDAARLSLRRVDVPRAVHVSYRMNDRIYWTGRKVWLQKGELLLTDGVNEVRGRCGNRIAMLPAGEVLPMGPPPEILDEVMLEPAGLDPLEAFPLLFPDTLAATLDEAMPLPPPDIPLPAMPLAFVGSPGEVIVPSTYTVPPGPVPEPATWMLVGVGSGLGVLRRWRRNRRPATRASGLAQP